MQAYTRTTENRNAETQRCWTSFFSAHSASLRFKTARAALEPTSDFDKIVDQANQLEAPPPLTPKPKKPGRKKKDGGK